MNTKSFTSYNRSILIILALILSMLIIGCSKSTTVSYDESRINSIMYNIETAFNNHDIDALMTYIHIDYLHQGMARWRIREIWLDRMAEYQLVDFLNISIAVQDDKATVSFTMKLISADETINTEEPETNGDLSYFLYDTSDWYVYGNQLNY